MNHDFIEFLQYCIAPVAMISGVGLLLLTITNRFGRVIDRSRILAAELDKKDVARREEKIGEVKILYKRSHYLRSSIAFITFSVISSSLMIPFMAFMFFFEINLQIVGYLLFILSVSSILFSAIYFFLDVILSLRAVTLEIKHYL